MRVLCREADWFESYFNKVKEHMHNIAFDKPDFDYSGHPDNF